MGRFFKFFYYAICTFSFFHFEGFLPGGVKPKMSDYQQLHPEEGNDSKGI